jgi:hypothetical protein
LRGAAAVVAAGPSSTSVDELQQLQLITVKHLQLITVVERQRMHLL